MLASKNGGQKRKCSSRAFEIAANLELRNYHLASIFQTIPLVPSNIFISYSSLCKATSIAAIELADKLISYKL